MTDLQDNLRRHGLSASAAATLAPMMARCSLALGHPRPHHLFAPGRVEFLGKHVDYAGGRSLLLTVERGFCLAFAPLEEPLLRIIDVERSEERSLPIATSADGEPGHWSIYAAAIARRIAANFPMQFRGAHIAFLSNLPIASGLSSSSALVVALFLAVARINDLPRHPAYAANIHSTEDLAGYLGALENGRTFKSLPGEKAVGTLGGSQDHTAILCCKTAAISQFSFLPVRKERVIPFPPGYSLLIASSGVHAEKTGAAMADYNRTSLRVQALLDLWNAATNRHDTTLAAILASASDARQTLEHLIRTTPHPTFSPADLQSRLDQFIAETDRIVPAVAAALAEQRIPDIGPLVDQSQHLAEQNLHNQIPETIHLTRTARTLGAAGASAFGAGWGGSVWALCKNAHADDFLRAWQKDYSHFFPSHAAQAQFFSTPAGPPAFYLDQENS